MPGKTPSVLQDDVPVRSNAPGTSHPAPVDRSTPTGTPTPTATHPNSQAVDRGAGAATDPAGPTGRLATWVAETTLDDVPASVRDRAKHLILDGIACALVGAQLPVSRIGVEGVTALD